KSHPKEEKQIYNRPQSEETVTPINGSNGKIKPGRKRITTALTAKLHPEEKKKEAKSYPKEEKQIYNRPKDEENGNSNKRLQ
ncbi:4809_t:CDS:2, partial [Ambispora leptoticha]